MFSSVLKQPTQAGQNIPNQSSEFVNKKIPMDGIELLLNRDKLPANLGKQLDNKISNNNEMVLSDIDDLSSDHASFKNNFSERHRNSIRSRKKNNFLKKKFNTFPKPSGFQQHTANITEIKSDDSISEDLDKSFNNQYVNEENEEEEEEEDEDEEDTEEDDEEAEEGEQLYENKWKSPSVMSKDEIISEKMDLIYRYGKLEGNGYKSGLDINIKTNLPTLRSEVNKLERLRKVQRSIRFQRKLLVSFTSGTEYCNKRYNPYTFALDGWSGDVLENIGDYDEVFEELHDKYSETVQMAPELRLMTMVGGSGLMFHLSNTLFKSSTPELSDILKSNPHLMKQVQEEALKSMAFKNSNDPMFNMMMQGINERKKQQSKQDQWQGRPGYAPPRTTGFTNPVPSNSTSSLRSDVSQVPKGQGIINQSIMEGPSGFDDILGQLDSNKQSFVPTETSSPKNVKIRRSRKKNKAAATEVIDLDI